jgi:hypothetical protein
MVSVKINRPRRVMFKAGINRDLCPYHGPFPQENTPDRPTATRVQKPDLIFFHFSPFIARSPRYNVLYAIFHIGIQIVYVF